MKRQQQNNKRKKKAFKFHSGTPIQDGEIDSLVKLSTKLRPKLCGLKLQGRMGPNFFWKNQIVFEIIFQTQLFFTMPKFISARFAAEL